jgi:hypothetical protein
VHPVEADEQHVTDGLTVISATGAGGDGERQSADRRRTKQLLHHRITPSVTQAAFAAGFCKGRRLQINDKFKALSPQETEGNDAGDDEIEAQRMADRGVDQSGRMAAMGQNQPPHGAAPANRQKDQVIAIARVSPCLTYVVL